MKINWKNKIYKGKNQDFLNYKSSITNKISQKASLRIERNKDFPNTFPICQIAVDSVADIRLH